MILVAKGCGHNKHFMAKTGGKARMRYFLMPVVDEAIDHWQPKLRLCIGDKRHSTLNRRLIEMLRFLTQL